MRTLFGTTEYAIKSFKGDYKLHCSTQFIECADTQLTQLFINKTDIKPSKNVGLTCSFAYLVDHKPEEIYVKGAISSFPIDLYVNHHWNLLTVLWESKSGRVYDIADTDIDCNDINFWFEDLDPLLYHKQLYPKEELPFRLKNLSYELVVTRLNMDCSIEMLLKQEAVQNAESILNDIDNFLQDFNFKSEKKNRKYGVVHNWQRKIEDNKLIYDLDTGSAGADFLKKLLRFLSELNLFLRVEIS